MQWHRFRSLQVTAQHRSPRHEEITALVPGLVMPAGVMWKYANCVYTKCSLTDRVMKLRFRNSFFFFCKRNILTDNISRAFVFRMMRARFRVVNPFPENEESRNLNGIRPPLSNGSGASVAFHVRLHSRLQRKPSQKRASTCHQTAQSILVVSSGLHYMKLRSPRYHFKY